MTKDKEQLESEYGYGGLSEREKLIRDHTNAQWEFNEWMEKLDKEMETYQRRMRTAALIIIIGVLIVAGTALWSAARADVAESILGAAAGVVASKNLCGTVPSDSQQAMIDMAEILMAVPENLELLEDVMRMHLAKEYELGNEEYCTLSRAALTVTTD